VHLARATVHFNAVTEKFSPHDTVFPITSSKELKDSTLSAACSLHTASGSTSSSTSSLRKRRLMEIAEDENEDKRQSILAEEHSAALKEPSAVGSQTRQAPSNSTSPPQLESATTLQSMAQDGSSLSPSGASENRPRSPTKSLDGRRTSSQSSRPDLYSYSSFGSNGRPKVKLGPRPSLDFSGRPQTSQSFGNYRPVSTLPPGLKLVSKPSKKSKDATQAQLPNPPPTMTLSPPPLSGSDSSPIQTTILVRPHTSGGRPTTSSGTSIKPPMSPSSSAPKSPTMTPEKLRLMKAMQLRKKQMASQAEPSLLPPRDEPQIPPIPRIRLSQGRPGELEDKLASLDDIARADSAIAIETPSMEKIAALDITRANSTPGSPTEPSEEAESTPASSVSDSTDETIQDLRNQRNKLPENAEPVKIPAGHDNESSETKSRILGDSMTEEAKQLLTSPIRMRRIGEYDEEKGIHKSNQDNREVETETQDPLSRSHEGVDRPLANAAATATEPAEEIMKSEEADLASGSMSNGSGLPSTESNSVRDKSAFAKSVSGEQVEASDIKESIEATQTESPPRQLKIPRSKFSVQPIEPTEVTNSNEKPSIAKETPSNRPKSPVGSTFSNESKRSITDDEQGAGAIRQARKKRRGLVEPIRTDISADRSGHNSETDLLSDDDLMDELQSATVQEAKPISVSKSPISPVSSRDTMKTPNEGNRFSRAFSNPLRKDSFKAKMLSPHTPNPESSRSVSASASFLNRANQQTTLPVVKKVNLGSGISQRIKALEKLSSSAASPSPPLGTTGPSPGASPAFFSVGQPRSRASSKSPSIVERSESLTRKNTSPTVSRESSPETLKFRDRSGSIQSRREAFNSPLTQPVRSRPESISVTARIIRDPSQPFPLKPEAGKDPLDFTPLDLQQSPLVIDHQKAIVAPPSPRKETIRERRTSKEVKKERRSSISIVKDLINDRRSSFAERRKSISVEPPGPSPARSSRPPSTHTNSPNTTRPRSVSSRRSSTSGNLPSSLSLLGLNPVSPTTPDDTSDKKSNRASRMLRLISSPFSVSRKSLAHGISPTVREELEPPAASSQFPQFHPIEVGDVNVQFPDNLLWKRRSMSIDSQGFLVLLQAQSNKGTEKSMAIKRYHLSDFRTPFIPEMEAQELPNSVVLDFIEGGGLQVAVEDRGGQMRLLEGILPSAQSQLNPY
jgi:hypothetical protein